MKTAVVTTVRNNRIRQNGHVNPFELTRSLNRGLQAQFTTADPREVWRKMFSPKELIAIKVNCLAGRGLSTHPELVQGIIAQLEGIGISKKNIIVFDRANLDLKRAGFKITTARTGVRCAGNDYFGYHPNLLIHKTIGSMISQVMFDVDAVINLPVLKDHGIAGFSGAMKNFFGVIHNPNKYHLNVGDPFIADLCSHDLIRKKVRLTICDALTAQYEGGPPFMPQFALQENLLLISTDMVAIDRVGWSMIEGWRRDRHLPSLKEVQREPKYIYTAADNNHRVGVADLNRIKINKVGL